MEVKPVCFDSLGVRSMCTFIETSDVKIIIDPSADLGKRRYGLPPHPVEHQALQDFWNKILEYSKIADIVIISHYHYDHFSTKFPEQFQGKHLIIKSPYNRINKSQTMRAASFLSAINRIPRQISIADGKTYRFGDTIIEFSPPFPHGSLESKLGYVVMTHIRCGGESIIHTSDVQGPMIDAPAIWIASRRPDIVILDGFSTWLLPEIMSVEQFEHSLQRAEIILRNTETLLIDHHLVRDLNYAEYMRPLSSKASAIGVKLITAAEYLGLTPNLLEARRRELYAMQESSSQQVEQQSS